MAVEKVLEKSDVLYPGQDGILSGLEIISDFSIETISKLNDSDFILDK
jgi:hypothetical protein